MSTEIKLKLSKIVNKMSEIFQEYTPEAGKEIDIVVFKAEANYTLSSVTKLVWDHGGPNEEILWSIKGSGKFDQGIIIPPEEVDGIKKLALILHNGDNSNSEMSGLVTLRIR